MTHPRLQAFFTGAVDELRGAYKKSEKAPNACKGSLREAGIRRAIEHSLPGVVHLYSGEIIDPCDRQSGQLDGILVHSSRPALATGADEDRIVPIEGVVAVLESKSNMESQWDQVIGTWEKLRNLRVTRHPPASIFTSPEPAQGRDIPFYVLAREGWKTSQTLAGKANELAQMFDTPLSTPNVSLVQFEPPGMGWARWEDGGLQARGEVSSENDRWKTLVAVWSALTELGARAVTRPIDWDGYLNVKAR